MEIRVKVVEEGGCVYVDYIKKEMIPLFLDAEVFLAIWVRFRDLTLDEIASLTRAGFTLRTDGDSRGVVISRVTPPQGKK